MKPTPVVFLPASQSWKGQVLAPFVSASVYVPAMLAVNSSSLLQPTSNTTGSSNASDLRDKPNMTVNDSNGRAALVPEMSAEPQIQPGAKAAQTRLTLGDFRLFVE